MSGATQASVRLAWKRAVRDEAAETLCNPKLRQSDIWYTANAEYPSDGWSPFSSQKYPPRPIEWRPPPYSPVRIVLSGRYFIMVNPEADKRPGEHVDQTIRPIPQQDETTPSPSAT